MKTFRDYLSILDSITRLTEADLPDYSRAGRLPQNVTPRFRGQPAPTRQAARPEAVKSSPAPKREPETVKPNQPSEPRDKDYSMSSRLRDMEQQRLARQEKSRQDTRRYCREVESEQRELRSRFARRAGIDVVPGESPAEFGRRYHEALKSSGEPTMSNGFYSNAIGTGYPEDVRQWAQDCEEHGFEFDPRMILMDYLKTRQLKSAQDRYRKYFGGDNSDTAS